MIYHQPSFKVKVDVTNPGQFFACCGLLELAHCLWPGAEGYFHDNQFAVDVPTNVNGADLASLIREIVKCEISGLSSDERDKLAHLEKLKKDRDISAEDEELRSKLGNQARKGSITIGKPFDLLLDWWDAGEEDVDSPKTWAGKQEIEKVALAAQTALLGMGNLARMFDYGCVLRKPKKYYTKASDESKVEPFYFDDRRFAHRLDAGFSLDALGMESNSFPAVELLCLIGLQRFRPSPAPDLARGFDFWTWDKPLVPPVAAAVASGVAQIAGARHYRFALRFRDDQKRYKAFGKATPIEGEL